MSNFQPIIKWSGSKRSQCQDILSYFPDDIDTYYEPFCGGCSMLMGLIRSDKKVNRYICSDINSDLINLWKNIKSNPDEVFSVYSQLWNELNKDDDKDRKRKFFEEQRDLYNKNHDPNVFFFIMRTTTNGMPRYNSKGEFNNSFHITRNGIEPDRLYPILTDWHNKLVEKDVQFIADSYENVLINLNENDFIYMDPPYFNTKGMYMKNTINFKDFFKFIGNLSENNIKYALSFDGKSGKTDNTYDLPKECYKQHLFIKSGNSSFKRTIGKDKHAIVYESLYLNF